MRGTSVTLVAGGISSLVAALYLVIAIRTLSTTDWGTASVLISLGSLLGGVLNFGDSLHQVRRIASTDEESGRKILANNVAVRLAITVAVLFVSCVIFVLGAGIPAIAIALLGAAFFMNSGSMIFLLGRKKFALVAVMPILEKTLSLALIFGFATWGDFAIETLAFVQAFSLIVTAFFMICLCGVPIAMWKTKLSFRSVVSFWRGSTSFGVSSLAPSLMQLDVPLVSAIAGTHQAALFSIGSRLVSPLGLIGNTLATVLLPIFSGQSIRRPTRRLIVLAVVAVTGTLVGLAVLLGTANFWLPLIFGQSYSTAVTPVQFYILSVAAGLFARPAAAILQAQGLEKLVAVAVATQIFGALVILTIGSYFAGASGAAVGLCSTNVVLAVYLWIRIVRRLPKKTDA